MPKSRLTAAVYLSLVFLSGALVGGLSYRLYAVTSVNAVNGAARPPRLNPEVARRHYMDDITAKVKLDDEQVRQVNQILDDTRSQYDQIRQKMNAEGRAIYALQGEKIAAILRDDQRPLFTAFRAERERMRQQMRSKQGKQP
jgi:flagellar biosynthesis/type III secretory pathway protein FliH